VNTSKLIYQVNDGAYHALGAVYDRGVSLLVGRTWTSAVTGGLTGNSATFGGGLFVAVDSGGGLFTSPDGETWTSRATGVGSGLAMAYGNGTWVALTATHTVTSTNGTSWSTHSKLTATVPGEYTGICYFSDVSLFVAVSNVGDISTSPDGVTWTSRIVGAGSTAGLFGVASGLGLVVAVGQAGRILTSFDGVTWTSRTTDFLTSLLHRDDDVCKRSGFARRFASSDGGRSHRISGGRLLPLRRTPDGVITADVTQGAASANRTTAQLANLVLARLTSAPSFAAGDVTALDLAASAVNGYWSIEDGVTCANVLDFLVGTPGASWFVGNDGSFHLKQLTAPSGTPDLTVVADDLTKLERVSSSDDGGGVPPWKIQVRWGKYYQTITSDIAGAVTDEDRAQFAQEWRDVTSSDSTILTEHPSSQVMVIESAFSAASDAQTESDRQLALRGTKRDLYDLTMALNDQTALIDINNVIEVIHPRFSLSVVGSPSGALSGGGLFRVLDVRPDAKNARVTFTVWGRSRYRIAHGWAGTATLRRSQCDIRPRSPYATTTVLSNFRLPVTHALADEGATTSLAFP
jgi:hypothetical protein